MRSVGAESDLDRMEAHVRARDRARMMDKLMDAYVGWRQACLEVEDAYRLWGSGHGPNAAAAFERCAAALDGEGRAADCYARMVGRVAAVLGPEGAAARGARRPARPAPSP